MGNFLAWVKGFFAVQLLAPVMPLPKPSLAEMVDRGDMNKDVAERMRRVVEIIKRQVATQKYLEISPYDSLVVVSGSREMNLCTFEGREALQQECRLLLATKVVFLLKDLPHESVFRLCRDGQMKHLQPMYDIILMLDGYQ